MSQFAIKNEPERVAAIMNGSMKARIFFLSQGFPAR